MFTMFVPQIRPIDDPTGEALRLVKLSEIRPMEGD